MASSAPIDNALSRNSENQHPDSLTRIQRLEATTKRPITISTTLTPSNLSQCHQQPQSRLFALPAELREIIFSLATAPYYAYGTYRNKSELHYRPDHQAHRTTSTTLLLTCRRIWLEAHHMPMQQAHHCYYLPDTSWDWDDSERSVLMRDSEYSMGSQAGLTMGPLVDFATRLTSHSRDLFRHLHVSANLGYLASHTRYVVPLLLSTTGGACPERLTITIRHVDWPGWETNKPLAPHAPGKWLTTLLAHQASPRLREIRLELETVQMKVDTELRPIVASLRSEHARIDRVDELGNQVCVELRPAESVSERTWEGPTNLNGGHYLQYDGLDRLQYRIVTLVWKVRGVVDDDGSRAVGKMQEVPQFAFSDAEQEPKGKLGPEGMEARRLVEERWEREGSLLRFVEQMGRS